MVIFLSGKAISKKRRKTITQRAITILKEFLSLDFLYFLIFETLKFKQKIHEKTPKIRLCLRKTRFSGI